MVGRLIGWRFKSNCPSVGPGTIDWMPSGIFKRDPKSYLREKTMGNSERLGGQARPGIEPSTSRVPVLVRRSTQPLMGPRMENLTFMPLLGFKPGTFRAAVSSPNHCTAWSAIVINGGNWKSFVMDRTRWRKLFGTVLACKRKPRKKKKQTLQLEIMELRKTDDINLVKKICF